MRELKEVLNTVALLLLFAAIMVGFFILRDIRVGQPMDWGLAVLSVLCLAPHFALLASGQALSASFFTELVFGASGAAERSYIKERALARAGRGKDAALGLLWRDRWIGDRAALWAVLEMAQYDPALASEAVRAATRLIGDPRSSQADRDHAGRQLQLAKVSERRELYPGAR